MHSLDTFAEFIKAGGAGAFGALTHEVVNKNSIRLPRIENGEVLLGVIGGMLVGAFVGIYIDGSFLTSMLSGFTGFAVATKLLTQNAVESPQPTRSIEQTIRAICEQEGVDPDLGVRVAKCESGLVSTATNTNRDGSLDRGCFQINNKYHPEVTETQAFDVDFATKWFCKAVKDGNLSWWDASKTCWSK